MTMSYSAFHLKNKEKNQGQTRQTQGCPQEQQVHMSHSESCSGLIRDARGQCATDPRPMMVGQRHQAPAPGLPAFSGM